MIPKFLQMSAWIWKIVKTVFWDISWFQKFGRTWNFVEIKLCKLFMKPSIMKPSVERVLLRSAKIPFLCWRSCQNVPKSHKAVVIWKFSLCSLWPLLKICWSIITYQHQLFPGKWVSPLISQIFSKIFFLLFSCF